MPTLSLTAASASTPTLVGTAVQNVEQLALEDGVLAGNASRLTSQVPQISNAAVDAVTRPPPQEHESLALPVALAVVSHGTNITNLKSFEESFVPPGPLSA